MTLQNLTLPERKRLTRDYPLLISSRPGAGKSRSIETLSPEDKKRTVLLDLEGKGLPNDFDDDYRTVIRIKPSGMIPPDKAHLYVDYDNVKYKSLSELQIYIRKALSHPDVDRLVIDSFSALVDQLESHFVTVNNGFTTWVNYSKELTEWFSLLKEETRFNAKYVYILGHYTPSKDPKDTDAEKFTKVKGTMHYRMVESHFNCVLSITDDHKFYADNDNAYDSTRCNAKLSPYESKDNSIAELEETFAELYAKPTQG